METVRDTFHVYLDSDSAVKTGNTYQFPISPSIDIQYPQRGYVYLKEFSALNNLYIFCHHHLFGWTQCLQDSVIVAFGIRNKKNANAGFLIVGFRMCEFFALCSIIIYISI